MPTMATKSNAISHDERPPCDCDACQTATIAADSRRAEIAQILDRLEWLELLAGSGVDDE